MFTENGLYCDKAFEKMKGKLLIQVKTPDDAVIFSNVYITEKDGLFNISLGTGCTYICDVQRPMELYAHYSLGKSEQSSLVKINPDEFNHLMIDYQYYYYRNQARVKKVRLQKIEHQSPDDLYN